MNTGVTAMTLIDCIAAIPCAGCRRPSALMTKLEKEKRAPALSPQQSAVSSVSATRRSCIVLSGYGGRFPDAAGRGLTGVAAEVPWFPAQGPADPVCRIGVAASTTSLNR